MKKNISIYLLFCILCARIYSSDDSFFEAIQWNTIYSACIGQYSNSEAGIDAPDPYDFYTPADLGTYLSEKSGRKTKTDTFYGVCFDYAYAAYYEIVEHLSSYNSSGLYESEFYIVGTNSDSSTITLYKPSTSGAFDIILNGEYLKIVATKDTLAHKNSIGQRATNRAWIWIKRNDGVWFWCDPTWTDNTGCVVLGYVNDYGEEIQIKPDEYWCKNYPAYLGSLPTIPPKGPALSPSTYSPRTSTTTEYSREVPANNYDYSSLSDTYIILSAGFLCHNLMDVMMLEEIGLSLSLEGGSAFRVPIMLQIDYFSDFNADRLLFNFNIGFQGGHWFTIYTGAGYGSYVVPLDDAETSDLWKINLGIRLIANYESFRMELSYLSDVGCIFGIYVGMGF